MRHNYKVIYNREEPFLGDAVAIIDTILTGEAEPWTTIVHEAKDGSHCPSVFASQPVMGEAQAIGRHEPGRQEGVRPPALRPSPAKCDLHQEGCCKTLNKEEFDKLKASMIVVEPATREAEADVERMRQLANEARGHLLERPCNKTQCNIKLLRIIQMGFTAADAIAALGQPAGEWMPIDDVQLWKNHHATYDTKISHYEFQIICNLVTSSMQQLKKSPPVVSCPETSNTDVSATPWRLIDAEAKKGQTVIIGGYVNGEWQVMNDDWYSDREMSDWREWPGVFAENPTHYIAMQQPPKGEPHAD